jgi:hypothetical protein
VHLDRAREHEATHAGADGRSGEPLGRRHVCRRVRAVRIARRFVLNVRSTGEVDDGRRVSEHRVEQGLGHRREIAHVEEVLLGRRLTLLRADDRAEEASRRGEMRDERAADEAAGAGDDDDARFAHAPSLTQSVA